MSKTHNNPIAEYPGYSDNEWRGRFASEQIEWLEPDQLLANPNNHRIHERLQQEQVESLLDTLGWVDVVKVNRNSGAVVDGHLRVTLAIRHKTQVPVLWLDLSETEERAALASLDYTASKAGIDLNILATNVAFMEIEFPALEVVWENLKIDFELNGNGHNPPDDNPPDPSQAKALREKYGVEVGSMFQIGEHLILCGDSTKWDDMERVTENKPVDLVFADPPYGVAIGDKNKFLNSFQPSGRNLENIAGDLMGKDELLDMLVAAFTNTRKAMADCAAIYVTAPQGGELGLMMMMMMSGLPVKHVLNWIKNAPTFSMGRLDYEYQHEPILYTWKKTHKHYGKGQYNTSTWFIDKPRASPEHPTMKPVELVENAILNSSERGQVVFDPFLGSGTTIIACERTGRIGRGIEKDPLHVATALERVTLAFPALPVTRVTAL